MLKKQLTLALAALLCVAACAPCARAQSGRRPWRGTVGRGLSGREYLKLETGTAPEAVGAAVVDPEAAHARGEDFDLRGLNAGRRSPVVYADHGGDHPNRTDKIIGVALLGYLVFVIYVTATSDGYAPSVHGSGGLRLRR